MYFYIQMLAKLFIIIGSINYLSSVLLNTSFNNYLPKTIVPILIIIIGLSGLYVGFNRDYYLPFLGHTVIPVGPSKPTENLKQMKLSGLPPNTIVMAWGSQSTEKVFEDPFEAYGDYANTEIKKTNDKGEVIIELPCPSEYYVNKFGVMKRKLDRHIHYRYQLPEYKGMFSRVYTKYLDEKCQ